MVKLKSLAKQKNLWDETEEPEELGDEDTPKDSDWEKDYEDYCDEQEEQKLARQEDEYLHWLYGDHIKS